MLSLERSRRERIIDTSRAPRSGTLSAPAIVSMSPKTSSSVVGLMVTSEAAGKALRPVPRPQASPHNLALLLRDDDVGFAALTKAL